MASLCRLLADTVPNRSPDATNDIFTKEDAEALRRMHVLADDRIVPVETGCCPHTAIHDDISANLKQSSSSSASAPRGAHARRERRRQPHHEVFSRALVDRQIFVLDVAGGDKVPRKGGPGVTTADLLVINKTDLAPLVGADLEVMRRDTMARAGVLPMLSFTSLVTPEGAAEVAAWVGHELEHWHTTAPV